MNRFAVFVLLLAALLSSGCGNDGGTDPYGGNNNQTVRLLRATINGTQFNGVTVSGAYSGGNLTFIGVAGSKSLQISAAGLPGTGTYSLAPGNAYEAQAIYIDTNVGTFATEFLGGSGSVTLTTATASRITGSFNFIAYTASGTGAGNPVVTVQSGTFDITYP